MELWYFDMAIWGKHGADLGLGLESWGTQPLSCTGRFRRVSLNLSNPQERRRLIRKSWSKERSRERESEERRRNSEAHTARGRRASRRNVLCPKRSGALVRWRLSFEAMPKELSAVREINCHLWRGHSFEWINKDVTRRKRGALLRFPHYD